MNADSPLLTDAEWDELLRTCIHCGLCLNACPTHRLTGDEVESPRGRLGIMRELLSPESGPAPESVRGPIDRCLGCLACQTVCPSGVPYGRLLGASRERLGAGPSPGDRIRTLMVDQVLSRPRLLAVLATVGQRLRSWLGSGHGGAFLVATLDALPRRSARWPRALSNERVTGERGEVAVLRGCAQWVFEPEVLEATCRLVEAAGFRPVIPEEQGCCGALSHHQGSTGRARELVRTNLRAFAGVEAVVTASAGCSAFLRGCDELFAEGSEEHDRAAALAGRSEDLLSWLVREGDRLRFAPSDERVVLQNPCHHRHAQSMVSEAASLLSRVPGVEILRAEGEDLCCGSAGSYQLHQPEMSHREREVKLGALLAGSPDRILSANPGCEFFLEAGIEAGGPVVEHLAVFLARQLETAESG